MQDNMKMNSCMTEMNMNLLETYSEYHIKNLNIKTKSSYVNYIKDNFEEKEHREWTRNILDTPKGDKTISEIIEKSKGRFKTLHDIAKEKRDGDLYIVNTDPELT